MRAEDIAFFRVETTATEHEMELRLVGELDIGTAARLRDSLGWATAEGVRSIVVDLSELEFVDSSGLQELVVALKRQRERDGDVVLRAPNPRIRRVLEIVGFDKVFTILEADDRPLRPF